ncbi:MAG: hypothetical protein WAT19_09340 [Ferruginibacter sp.]
MKERLLTGWTPTRVMYTVIGILITIQAFYLHEWFLGIAGLYFTSMGVFGFGCAGGQCRR